MSELDDIYRMQQEVEEQRMLLCLEALQRVSRGISTEKDALFLAGELGLTTEWRKHAGKS